MSYHNAHDILGNIKRLIMAATLVVFSAQLSMATVFTEEQEECTNPVSVISVKSGEEFSIVLKSDGSTGFQWQLAKDTDESFIEYVGDEYLKSPSNRVGAAGREKWTFKAKNPVKTTISFEYLRRWEKGVPPAKTVNFDVEIR